MKRLMYYPACAIDTVHTFIKSLHCWVRWCGCEVKEEVNHAAHG